VTVTTASSEAVFIGNDSATVLPFNFRFFKAEDLQVTRQVDATGVVTTLALGIDYTVQGAGNPNGGSVTLTTPAATGTTIKVKRVLSMVQLINVMNQGKFFPEVHENAWDYMTMLIQQVSTDGGDIATRALRAPAPIGEIPAASQRSGKLLSFDQTGQPVAVVPAVDSAVALAIDLANATDPAKGAGMVGWSRAPLAYAIDNVGRMLDAQAINIWEFAHLVTDKGDEDPATWDWVPAFDAAIAVAGSTGRHAVIQVTGRLGVGSTVHISSRYCALDCTNGAVVALPGFYQETAVVRHGTTGSVVWSGYSPSLVVDCTGQRVKGVTFENVNSGGYGFVCVSGSLFVGIHCINGYELKLQRYSAIFPMILGGAPANADLDSVGLLVSMSDSEFGVGDIKGAAVGVKATGNNNTFAPCHAWGVYKKAGIPQSVPMLAGFWNEGQSNTFIGCLADSPSLVDFNSAASLTNGGYGYVNRVNGFQSTFVGCKVFVPDRVPFGETLPTNRLVGFNVGQSASYIACEITDYTSSAFVAGIDGRYSGSALNTSLIVGRADIRLPSTASPVFNTRLVANKGLDFNATYDFAPSSDDTWGNVRFKLDNWSHLKVYSNYEGTKVTTRIPRYNSCTTTFRTATLQGWLTPSDVGYSVFDTTLVKPVWWTGTAWVLADGTTP
jgi:hypothetical protein